MGNNGDRPTATEQAKRRAQANRPPTRSAGPRMDMNGGAPQPPAGQDPNGPPQGANPADLLHQSDAQPMVDERGQPRPVEQINADVEAYNKAVEEHQAQKEQPSTEQSSKEREEEDEYGADDSWWNWQERDVLANSKRRKAIEANLKPMRIEDLLLHNEVRQSVVVIPAPKDEDYGLEFEFRSISVDEDLAVKRMMSGYQGSNQYISDRYAIMNLVCGLFRLNGTILPNHLNGDGNFDEDLYNAKWKIVRKWPYNLVQDLVNNWTWFEDRVRKLFVLEDLGNG